MRMSRTAVRGSLLKSGWSIGMGVLSVGMLACEDGAVTSGQGSTGMGDGGAASSTSTATATAGSTSSQAATGSGSTTGGQGGGLPQTIVDLAAGFTHTCVRLESGAVRCWGGAAYGQLGYGNIDDIGGLETPAAAGAGDVSIGGDVLRLAVGDDHDCAVLGGASGVLRCWGRGHLGRLGYGNVNDIGDDELPSSAGDVMVGKSVLDVASGADHTCAVVGSGEIRCWGFGAYGKLGYGNTKNVGDDETPASVGDVDVGGSVSQLSLGDEHTCALLTSGAVRCWGRGSYGQLGYGNPNDIGDDEAPATAGDVDVGGAVAEIVSGYAHNCVRRVDGAVRCWGANGSGQLGYANNIPIGATETPGAVGDVDLGGTAVQIVAGYVHTCALLEGGAVRCWGQGNTGQLGYGSVFPVGDDETPACAGDVDIGGKAIRLAAGYAHTCALLDTGSVRCWGYNSAGQLGYGNTDTIGDDELPKSAGDVQIF